MKLDIFLSRLQKVRKNGNDYVACCDTIKIVGTEVATFSPA